MSKLFYSRTFWLLYTLGLTVVFPTYLYYGNSGYGTFPLSSATEAFVYLGLGIVIWSIALIAYIRFYIHAVILKSRIIPYSILLLLLLLGAFVYPVFSYGLESNGSGWRFLKSYHPWILVPFMNLGMVFITRLVMNTIMGVAGSSFHHRNTGRDSEFYGR